jgi:phosphoglycolate phosphatase-like HAD superfamily hydrolase
MPTKQRPGVGARSQSPRPESGIGVGVYEQDYRTFISSLNFRGVTKILVIANTGEVTVKMLREWLTRHVSALPPRQRIKLEILLRSPHISDKKRFDSITRTIKEIHNFSAANRQFDTEVRYYASVCPLRATIFEYADNKYSGHLSFSDWGPGANLNQRDAAHEHAFTKLRVKDTEPLLSVFLSWFRHFWGYNKIHTLIFDFDDTLFFTTAAQVHGWIRGIERALETNVITLEQLADDVEKALRSTQADSVFTDIFFEEQEEARILRRLTKIDLSTDAIRSIRQERVIAREKETLRDAMQIPNVISEVQALSTNHQLVIVSATSDELIRRVLEKHSLLHLFSYIFGRDSPLRSWNSVETKAQNFIKISTMLGIPLERMIFVGDSDADYRAAKQLGMPFIENRFNAGRYGRPSLIREKESQDWWVLSSNSGPGDLSAIVREIEAQVD